MKSFCKLRYTELMEKFQKTDQGIRELALTSADEFLLELNKKFNTVPILHEFERNYAEFLASEKDELNEDL